MKNRSILLSAAIVGASTLAIASFSPRTYAQQDQSQTGQSQSDQSAAKTNSNGGSAGEVTGRMADMSNVNQADRDQINKTLAEATKDAVQPGKFSDLINCLAKTDRDRIQAQKPDTAQLDQTVKSFGDTWKNKYGQDFEIADPKQSFAQFSVMRGESMEAHAANDRLGTGAGASASNSGSTANGTSGGYASNAAGQNNPGSSAQSNTNADAQDQAQAAAAREGDKAHVMIPASHGLPELTINFVKEGADWKINISDNVDGNQLAQSLQSQLAQSQSMQAMWPSDQTRAQAAIAHHVALALAGKNASASGAASDTGSSTSGGTSGTDTGGTSR